ncbi:MAG TPA: hypothetical protein VK327_12545 [Candidatus Paceibacterota bacterium]|nr:hypothetical protein [Candidatus Paceibacterota bacterium]
MTTLAKITARSFCFERDTFAYHHELVWKYHFDPVTGAMTTYRADPPPTYYHRCFIIVRAARLFFDYARFAPELPEADAETYHSSVRKIIASNPRRACADADRIVIPGYDGLRSFSRAHEALLKAECGAAWESYFLRSHWRMIFRVTGRFQEKIAAKLKRSLQARGMALVHLYRFPRITINHGIALYGFTETPEKIEFVAYDPNIPEHPVTLVFEKARRAFTFAPNIYWGGGVTSVIEIYCDFPY